MTLMKIAAKALPLLALVAAPVAASAAQPVAQKLSLSKIVAKRAISKPGKQNRAGEEGLIILVLAGAAVVAGTLAATGGDNPSSP